MPVLDDEAAEALFEQAIDALEVTFGFSALRGVQEGVIRRLLSGESAVGVAPTGGGKSLCFQLPALVLPHLTLVISPLISLMKDQVDALVKRGVKAAQLDSSLSMQEARAVKDSINDGSLKILYVAPERLVRWHTGAATHAAEQRIVRPPTART